MSKLLRIRTERIGANIGRCRRRLFLMLMAVAATLQLPQAIPCNGSRTITPTCGKTVVLTKVGPDGPILGAGAVGFFTYPVNVFARGSNFLPAPACPQPVSVVVDVVLTCDDGSVETGTSGPTAITPGFTDIDVIVVLQNGPARECRVSATAEVTFADGSIVTAVCPESPRGPTVCIVAPVAPGVARLDLERLTTPVLAVHAGDVGVHSYRIKNNDPAESFTGVLRVGSKNTSTIPEDTSGTGNVFGVSDPSGDAFGLYFADEIPAGICPPLPPHPHLQRFREVTREITLLPGQEIFVDLMHRPYGGCPTGSCNESRVRLDGEFSDSSRGLACTNAAVVVDNSIPPNIGACPGIGSVGQVVAVDQVNKIANFQILIDPILPLGSHLPIQMRGNVAGFGGFQVNTNLLREDNNRSVRDVTTIRNPAGGSLPPGAVLEGELQLQLLDPTGSNQLRLDRVELAQGAPSGLAHLAPAIHMYLSSLPLDLLGSPPSSVDAFVQFGVLGYPRGGGPPVPISAPIAPDEFNPGRVIATIPLPEDLLLDWVELNCDVRLYGFGKPANPLEFQGNLIAPTGVAGLQLEPSSGHLVVSNIGSSGLDGVSIDLGDPQGSNLVKFADPLPLPPDPNFNFNLQARGRVLGIPGELPLGGVQIQGSPTGNPVLIGDFAPIEAQATFVQVYGGGRLVGSAILPPGGQLGTLSPIDPIFGMPELCGCGKFAPGFPYPLPCFFWEFDRLGAFHFPNTGPLIGDKIALFAGGSPLQVDRITDLDLSGANLAGGQLTISNIGSSGEDGVRSEPLPPADALRADVLFKDPPQVPDRCVDLFGNSHHALGGARLLPDGDRLVVSNIGSSGEDGVRIDLGAADNLEVRTGIDLRHPGARFELGGVGSVGGTPGQPLGLFGCQNVNGAVQAVADYKLLGIPTVEIRLLLGGVPQATITEACGVIGTVAPGPGGGFPQIVDCGKLAPLPVPCFFIGIDRPVRFTPASGGPAVLCDRVEALAAGIPEPITGLDQVLLRATNLGVFEILGESSSAPPQIESVTPDAATTGEILTLRGNGFDPDPDNNCVVVMRQGDPVAIPCVVLSSTSSEMRVRLGPIPPNGGGPAEIMLGTGRGERGFFEPGLPGIQVVEPVWLWKFTGGETQQGVPFNPIPTPPAPGTVWFEEPEVVEGELCLRLEDPANPGRPFSWFPVSKVEINARLRDHSDFFGFDQFASCLRFTDASSPEECAWRICDSIRCAWFQQSGIWVECRVEIDPDSGIPVIYLGFADGIHQVDWGTFSVCVTDLTEPEILSVDPPAATTGDIVTITGRGFDPDPDNNCVIVMIGNESIGLEVLGATGEKLITRVGPVPPGAGPGQIMVGRGKGRRGFFQPIFPDIELGEPVWVWDFPNAGETLEGFPFEPVPTPPDPEDLWFFSGPPENGQLCVTIPRFDWDPDCKISISARMRDHATGRGHDHLSACIRFPEAGSFEDCLARICDTIRCSWAQLLGFPVECTLDFTANDGTICLSFPPPFVVDWGNLSICIDCPKPPADPPQVDLVDRTEARVGDMVRIQGHGFGNDPDDLCVVVRGGDRLQPFNVDSFFDVFFDITVGADVIQAPMGTVTPDALPGPVMVDLGEGLTGPVVPLFPDVTFTREHWGWKNDPRVPAFPGPPLTPLPVPPPPNETWFFNEPPSGGMMCIFIDGDWGTRSKVTISGRMRDHTTGKGYDQFSSGVMINGPMSAFECAIRICDVISCTWSQLAGVRVLCIPEPVGNDGAKITLLFENGSVDWGNISICVTRLDGLLTFDQWKVANGVIEDLEDLELDGIPAIIEAYLGLDPNKVDTIEAVTDPAVSVRFRRDPAVVGLEAYIETSTNLLDYRVIAVNPPSDLLGNISVLFPDLGPRGFWRFGVRRW